MSKIKTLLGSRISSDGFDRQMGQWLFFANAPVILALSIWKLSTLNLTEGQMFIGVTASLTLSMTFVTAGLCLKTLATPDKR
jgi:hypothetical protein